MTTIIEQRVKVFLENWNLREGNLDTDAVCQACGRDLVDGKFAMIDGVLICLECKERNQ